MEFPRWTHEETDNYNRNYKREKLGPFYLTSGISTNNPHKRLEYLIEKLNVSELEQKEIFKKMEEREDKGYLLAKLEDRAIMNFF